MGCVNPVGLCDLLHAWERLGDAYDVERVAATLELALESAEPLPTPPPSVEVPPPLKPTPEPRLVEDLEAELSPPSGKLQIEHQPGRGGWELSIPAEPLAPDPDEQPMPRETLFARLVRDIVRRTLSTPLTGREPDLDGLVELLSRGEAPLRIPRRPRPSLRKGVQILSDISRPMAPFIDDQRALVEFIGTLIGESLIEDLRCDGVPGPCWGSAGRQEYRSPSPGTPILILSDLGIGQPPFSMASSSASDWRDFILGLDAACTVVAYVPYRPLRWPSTLRNLAHLEHWDRPLPPLADPKSLVAQAESPEEEIVGQILDLQRSERPGVVELARGLSLAARIEPELLRAIRVKITPWVGAGAEADILFGGLIEASSPLYSVFLPEAQRLLQRELAADPAHLSAVADFLESYREIQGAPVAVRLEERLNRLYCKVLVQARAGVRDPLSLNAMEAALARALRTLVSQEGERDTRGLAHWALRAVPGLPDDLRRTSTAQALVLAAGLRVGVPAISAEQLGDPERIRSVLPRDLTTVPVGVRWSEEGLYFTEPVLEGDPQIRLPDTHPRVFWVDRPGGAGRPRRYELAPGERVLVPLPEITKREWEFRVRTVAGDRWVLRPLVRVTKRKTRKRVRVRLSFHFELSIDALEAVNLKELSKPAQTKLLAMHDQQFPDMDSFLAALKAALPLRDFAKCKPILLREALVSDSFEVNSHVIANLLTEAFPLTALKKLDAKLSSAGLLTRGKFERRVEEAIGERQARRYREMLLRHCRAPFLLPYYTCPVGGREFMVDVTLSSPPQLEPPLVTQRIVSAFKKHFGSISNKTVCDMGTGKLRNLEPFLEAGFTAFLCDYDDQYEYAASENRLIDLQNKYRKKQLDTWIFPRDFRERADEFDSVLLMNILNIIPYPGDRKRVLDYCIEKLKRGGLLAWHTPYGDANMRHLRKSSLLFGDGWILRPHENRQSFYAEFRIRDIREMLADYPLEELPVKITAGKNKAMIFQKT